MRSTTEINEVTCILCPIGCLITLKTRRGEISDIKNAGCNRGKDYSIKEVKCPVRDFFTTVRVKGGKIPMLSVRSTKPIPKDMLNRCASELAKLVVPAPVKIGDIIVRNMMNKGIDIIATKNVDKA